MPTELWTWHCTSFHDGVHLWRDSGQPGGCVPEARWGFWRPTGKHQRLLEWHWNSNMQTYILDNNLGAISPQTLKGTSENIAFIHMAGTWVPTACQALSTALVMFTATQNHHINVYMHKTYFPFTVDKPLIKRMSLTAPADTWLTVFINQHATFQRKWNVLKTAYSDGDAWFPYTLVSRLFCYFSFYRVLITLLYHSRHHLGWTLRSWCPSALS